MALSQRRAGDPVTDLYTRLEKRARTLVEFGVPEKWCQCPHGWLLGYVMRPWTGSPNCPQCRRYPARWLTPEETARRISESATPLPPAIPGARPRALFIVKDAQ